jgi:hypothetical protein
MPVTARAVIARLAEQEKTDGNLPALLDFYRQLLEVQERIESRITVPLPVFSKETIRTHALDGKPLVESDRLAIDWPLLRQGYCEVVALFGKYPELFGVLPAGLVALPPGFIINRRTVKAWFRGREIRIPVPKPPHDGPQPTEPSADPTEGGVQALLKALFAAVLKPFLVRQAATLAGALDPEMWRRDYCPVCGGNPDMAYLARDTGSRWLVCTRCDTEWLYQRVQCPYCGNSDQNKLSYLADEKEVYRLYVCEECRHYLKAIDLRKFSGEALFPLERLLTIDLDRQAQERGYVPVL